jgi:hypothetical protein
MKVPPSTMVRFANLPSLVFPGKNKVGYFLDRPRKNAEIVVNLIIQQIIFYTYLLPFNYKEKVQV